MVWAKKKNDIEFNEGFEINPHHYANRLIQGVIDAPIKALEANKSFDEGLMVYTIYVELLETLCRANGWIGREGDDYQSILEKKVLSMKAEIDSERVVPRRDSKISKAKFELLLSRILESRMKEGVLKL